MISFTWLRLILIFGWVEVRWCSSVCEDLKLGCHFNLTRTLFSVTSEGTQLASPHPIVPSDQLLIHNEFQFEVKEWKNWTIKIQVEEPMDQNREFQITEDKQSWKQKWDVNVTGFMIMKASNSLKSSATVLPIICNIICDDILILTKQSKEIDVAIGWIPPSPNYFLSAFFSVILVVLGVGFYVLGIRNMRRQYLNWTNFQQSLQQENEVEKKEKNELKSSEANQEEMSLKRLDENSSNNPTPTSKKGGPKVFKADQNRRRFRPNVSDNNSSW